MNRRRLYGLVLVGLGGVVGINGAVRVFGGGGPSLLSPFFLPEKVQALAALAAHVPSHLWSSCGEDSAAAVRAAARRHGVDGRLALAMAATESSLDPHAISHAGAMGLMQLMPGTAGDLEVDDPFDAGANADGGVRYMKGLLRRYRGDRRRALAAYNAGPNAIPRQGRLRLGSETSAYVRVVLARSARMKRTVAAEGPRP